MTERRLKGIPAAPGIALGQIIHHSLANERERAWLRSNADAIAPDAVATEIAHLHESVSQVQDRILASLNAAHAGAGTAEAAIFEAHALMLEDPALIDAAAARIREHHEPAATALRAVADDLIRQIGQLDDDYLRERAADIDDVATQIIRAVIGAEDDLSALPRRSLVVAAELFPSDTAVFDPEFVAGFVTERGGRLGHVAILARALGIPAVLGVAHALEQTDPGEPAIINGDDGVVILSPEPETLARLDAQLARPSHGGGAQRIVGPIEAVTRDGVRITLRANIGTLAEARSVLAYGAEGVGLFRSEFLFQRRATLPSEREQVEAYRTIAEAMAGQLVTIRTLDAGGDKPLPSLTLPSEDNPALGTRGLRLLLDHPDLLRTQLRALLRAATSGNIAIMFPVVATLDDVRLARRALQAAQAELVAEGIDHRADVPVGIMIEVPSAAIMADLLIREVDFFSIGTNDLAQYTLAVDRTNERLAQRYHPLDTAVLRLIERAVGAAQDAGKPVGVCGEIAGDPEAIVALLGLGIRELSMSAPSLARAADVIRSVRVDEASTQMRRRLAGDSAT